jgi:hypothetical protein
MSLSLAKSTWSAMEVFLSSQLNAITTQLLRAMDGTGGGNYTPTSAIGIGGTGGLSAANTKINTGGTSLISAVTPDAAIEMQLSAIGFKDTSATVIIPGLIGNSIVSGETATFPIVPVDGSTLTGAKMHITQAVGTPGTEAQLRLRTVSTDGATVTTLGTATATAGSAAKVVTLSGLNHTVNRGTTTYALDVIGEVAGQTITLNSITLVYTYNGLPLFRT